MCLHSYIINSASWGFLLHINRREDLSIQIVPRHPEQNHMYHNSIQSHSLICSRFSAAPGLVHCAFKHMTLLQTLLQLYIDHDRSDLFLDICPICQGLLFISMRSWPEKGPNTIQRHRNLTDRKTMQRRNARHSLSTDLEYGNENHLYGSSVQLQPRLYTPPVWSCQKAKRPIRAINITFDILGPGSNVHHGNTISLLKLLVLGWILLRKVIVTK